MTKRKLRVRNNLIEIFSFHVLTHFIVIESIQLSRATGTVFMIRLCSAIKTNKGDRNMDKLKGKKLL